MNEDVAMARAVRDSMKGQTKGKRVARFWERVTQGMQMNELWGQFRADARTSYRLYSQEVDTNPGSGEIDTGWTRLIGGALMFGLLMMEVGDRVVMKRDLQIAKEIQAWLLPAQAPEVPGLQIAFATKPANTVAGDYYDVFARPGSDGKSFLLAVADVAGK